MALSKAATNATILKESIESLIEPVEEFDMDVLAESRSHLLDRLTQLYPNTKQATVREIISNAIDATSKVSNPKPIQVEFDEYQGTFVVRDFGIGMNYFEITKYCRYYGASNKNDDMTQIGAYGLGVKAPLAYTTEFSIKSIKNGLANLVTLSNSSAGYKLKVIYKNRPTDEPTGTEVSIPVRLEDQEEFLKTVKKYQEYSLDLPIVINGEDPTDRSKDWFTAGEILLDEDENTGVKTFGRVLVNPTVSSHSMSTGLWLGGWIYRRSLNYRGDEYNLLVELKPGVVNFSSSRDSITEDDKYFELTKRINTYLKSDKFHYQCLEAIDGLDISDDEKVILAFNMKDFCDYKYYQSSSQKDFLSKVLGLSDEYLEMVKKNLNFYKTIENLYSNIGVKEVIKASRSHLVETKTPTYNYQGDCKYASCVGKNFEKNLDNHKSRDFLSSVVVKELQSYRGSEDRKIFYVTDSNNETSRGFSEHRRAFIAARGDIKDVTFVILEENAEIPSIALSEENMKAKIEKISMADMLAEARKFKRENKNKTPKVKSQDSKISGYLSEKDSLKVGWKSDFNISDVDAVVVYKSCGSEIDKSRNGLDNSGKLDVEKNKVLYVRLDEFNTAQLQNVLEAGKKCFFTVIPKRGVYMTKYAEDNFVNQSNVMNREVLQVLEKNYTDFVKYAVSNLDYSTRGFLGDQTIKEIFRKEFENSNENISADYGNVESREKRILFSNLTRNPKALEYSIENSKISRGEKTSLRRIQFIMNNTVNMFRSNGINDGELMRALRSTYVDRVLAIKV